MMSDIDPSGFFLPLSSVRRYKPAQYCEGSLYQLPQTI